jgi:hypothetical protein
MEVCPLSVWFGRFYGPGPALGEAEKADWFRQRRWCESVLQGLQLGSQAGIPMNRRLGGLAQACWKPRWQSPSRLNGLSAWSAASVFSRGHILLRGISSYS